MERERLKRILEEPAKVAREDLVGLKAMVERYPWFSGAHMLLAVGEHDTGEVLYDGTLAKTSAHIPSREVLFDLVEEGKASPLSDPEQLTSQSDKVPALELVPDANVKDHAISEEGPNEVLSEIDTTLATAVQASTEADDLLDRQLREAALAGTYDLTIGGSEGLLEVEGESVDIHEELANKPEKQSILETKELAKVREPFVPASPVLQPAVLPNSRLSFTDWLDLSQQSGAPREVFNEGPETTVTRSSALARAAVVLPTHPVEGSKALIDRFIQQENPPPTKKAEFYTPQQAAKRSLDDSGGLVSETLAKIYVAQGNLTKAIDAYRRLGLKHPEKSAYFATLQKELEEQLNK